MNHIDDPKRNTPVEEGRKNDPDLRDDSGIQPGINTVSSSEYDKENEDLTETSADSFRPEEESDKYADPDYSEKNG